MIETTEFEGIPAVVLRSPEGLRAAFAPAAGMVGVSLRDGEDELLGQRRGLRAYAERGRTMGIPLLHPWANRLDGDRYEAAGVAVELSDATPGLGREEHGLPIHGLLAGSPRWRVLDERADALSAELDSAGDPGLAAGFPFPHRLRLDVALRGRTLSVAATLTATGERPVPIAFGFHPYFVLPGVPRPLWRVELPELRRLELDERGIPTGAEQPASEAAFALADRLLDDGYVGVADGATFAVSGGGRRIAVTFEQGYPAAQVFAPLVDDVVCFEPMTAPANALVSHQGLRLLEPGETYAARFSVAVTREG